MSINGIQGAAGFDPTLYNSLLETARAKSVSADTVDQALLDALGAGKDFQAAVAKVKVDLPSLAAPRESSPRNLNGWVGMPSPAALIASLIVDEAAEQRTANRSVIRSQGELIAANMEEQADKIKQGATQKFACAVAGAVVNMAAGIASIGVGAAGIKAGTDAQSVAVKSQAVSSIISSVGTMISAGGDYAQSLRSAETKRLEADAERIRTSMELTKQTNEAMRDLIAKSLDFMNSMQANMNQTRTKILG